MFNVTDTRVCVCMCLSPLLHNIIIHNKWGRRRRYSADTYRTSIPDKGLVLSPISKHAELTLPTTTTTAYVIINNNNVIIVISQWKHCRNGLGLRRYIYYNIYLLTCRYYNIPEWSFVYVAASAFLNEPFFFVRSSWVYEYGRRSALIFYEPTNAFIIFKPILTGQIAEFLSKFLHVCLDSDWSNAMCMTIFNDSIFRQ